MNEFASSQKKILLIGAGVVVVLLLVVLVLMVSSGGKKQTAQNAQPTPAATAGNNGSTLFYSPTTAHTYTGLGDLTFVPQQVNAVTFSREKLITTAKKEYPTLTDKQLISQVNETIFTWLALQDKKLSGYTKRAQNVSDYTGLENQYHSLKREYEQNLIQMDGLVLPVQFAGVRPENVKKLGKKESELKAYAKTLITNYRDGLAGFTNKYLMVQYFNNDPTVLTMNNGGKATEFHNYQLYPALFVDPNFYSIMQAAPVGKVSDILTLQRPTSRPGIYQDYAYAVVFVAQKTGINIPTIVAVNQFIAKATIK